MNKFIMFLVLVIVSSNLAYGQVDVPYTSDGSISYSVINDTVYQLNNSNTLTELELFVSVNTFPSIQVYSFIDSHNNIISIKTTYNKAYKLLLYYIIEKKVEIFYNGQVLNIQLDGSDYNNTFYNETIKLLSLSEEITLRNRFVFEDHKIIIPNLHGVDNWKNGYTKLTYAFFPKTINIPFANDLFTINSMKLTYIDQVTEIVKYGIDKSYNNLNFVFKFVFLVARAIFYIPTVANVIDESDYLEYQRSVLTPLQMLNMLINALFTVIKIFFVMGVLFTFAFVECFIFVYSYVSSRNGDVFDALNRTIETSVSFWTKIIINPTIWFFERIVKIWS